MRWVQITLDLKYVSEGQEEAYINEWSWIADYVNNIDIYKSTMGVYNSHNFS